MHTNPRMQTLEDSRITKKAYSMLLNMDSRGITCWATKIRKLLSEAGFYYVWLYQGVGHQKTFVHLSKDRLIYVQARMGRTTQRKRAIQAKYGIQNFITTRKISLNDRLSYKTRANMLPFNATIHKFSNIIEDRYCIFCD